MSEFLKALAICNHTNRKIEKDDEGPKFKSFYRDEEAQLKFVTASLDYQFDYKRGR